MQTNYHRQSNQQAEWTGGIVSRNMGKVLHYKSLSQEEPSLDYLRHYIGCDLSKERSAEEPDPKQKSNAISSDNNHPYTSIK